MRYATDARLRDLGLSIPKHVEEGVRDFAPICASCNDPQAPIGLDSRREYVSWAEKRARLAPVERLSSVKLAKALPGSRHAKCAACNDRLLVVVGLPARLLELMLDGLDEASFNQVKGFLEYRFVFLLCLDCAAASAEDEITIDELTRRYHKVRGLLAEHNWDVTPAPARRFTERFFARLAAIVQSRDAQSAR